MKTPFITWKDFHKDCENHLKNTCHQHSKERAANFSDVVSNKKLSVVDHIEETVIERFLIAEAGIRSIARSVIVCGKQAIALCGHEDNFMIDPKTNYFGESKVSYENFSSILFLQISSGDQALSTHRKINSVIFCLNFLCSYLNRFPEMQRGVCRFCTDWSQNELISIAGKLIQKKIVARVKEAKHSAF